jgi:hypothetical protein
VGTETIWSRRRWIWFRIWPVGVTSSETRPGGVRGWPAAVVPGSSKGSIREGDGGWLGPWRRPENGLLAPLPLSAGALEHLAVLLLAHALAALLDQRSHDGRQSNAVPDRCGRPTPRFCPNRSDSPVRDRGSVEAAFCHLFEEHLGGTSSDGQDPGVPGHSLDRGLAHVADAAVELQAVVHDPVGHLGSECLQT